MSDPPPLNTLLAMSREQQEILLMLRKIDRSLTTEAGIVGHLQRCADDGSITPTPEWVGRMIRLTLLAAHAFNLNPQTVFEEELARVAKAVAAGEIFDGDPYWGLKPQV